MSKEIITPPLTMASKFRRRKTLHDMGLCGLPTAFMQGVQTDGFNPGSMLSQMTEQAIDAGLDSTDRSDWTLIVRTSALPLPGSTTHSSPALIRTEPNQWVDLSSKAKLNDEELRRFLRMQGHYLVHLEQPKLQRQCVHGRFITDNNPNPLTQLDLVTGVSHARSIDHMRPVVLERGISPFAAGVHQLRVDRNLPRDLIAPMLQEVSQTMDRVRSDLMPGDYGIKQRLTCEFRTFYPRNSTRRQTHVMDFLHERI